jgi:hypothetical protein
MTDGDDTTSFFDARTVVETAKHTHGQLSFVVLRGGGTRADGAVRTAFQTIARTTGGEVLEIAQNEQLSPAFLTALANFRMSYLLRYSPTGVAPGGWHDVVVTVPSGQYSVRARRGYSGG